MPQNKKNSIIGKEIFSVGEWYGDPYDTKDLEEMCKAFNETANQYKPYMKLGHAKDQVLLQQEGLPAAGWIENLRVQGKKLICDLVDIPEKIYKLICEGAYRYVSSEILWNIDFAGKKYNRMLAGVALLGAEMPAVTNLNDFANLYKLDAKFIKTYTIENKGESMPETKVIPPKEDDKVTPPVAPKAPEAPTAPIAEKKEENVNDVKTPPSEKEKVEAPKVEKMAEGTDVETRIAALEKLVNDLTSKLGVSEMECAKYRQEKEIAETEAFIAENKIAPAAKEYVKELLGADKKEYAMGDKKLSKKDLVKEIIKIYSSTNGVNLEENSTEGNANASKDQDDIRIEEIKKYAQENKISFREAFEKLNVDENDNTDSEDENEED